MLFITKFHMLHKYLHYEQYSLHCFSFKTAFLKLNAVSVLEPDRQRQFLIAGMSQAEQIPSFED
jgi:hypothetical protein